MRIHMTRVIQTDLQSEHFYREIPLQCWWHNMTIRLWGGGGGRSLEKPRGLYLEGSLQDTCLRKSWGHPRVVGPLWWMPADSAEKTSVCDLTTATEGAHDDGLRRSGPSAPDNAALHHSDLSGVSQKSRDGLEELTDGGSPQGQPPTTGGCLLRLHSSG